VNSSESKQSVQQGNVPVEQMSSKSKKKNRKKRKLNSAESSATNIVNGSNNSRNNSSNNRNNNNNNNNNNNSKNIQEIFEKTEKRGVVFCLDKNMEIDMDDLDKRINKSAKMAFDPYANPKQGILRNYETDSNFEEETPTPTTMKEFPIPEKSKHYGSVLRHKTPKKGEKKKQRKVALDFF